MKRYDLSYNKEVFFPFNLGVIWITDLAQHLLPETPHKFEKDDNKDGSQRQITCLAWNTWTTQVLHCNRFVRTEVHGKWRGYMVMLRTEIWNTLCFIFVCLNLSATWEVEFDFFQISQLISAKRRGGGAPAVTCSLPCSIWRMSSGGQTGTGRRCLRALTGTVNIFQAMPEVFMCNLYNRTFVAAARCNIRRLTESVGEPRMRRTQPW